MSAPELAQEACCVALDALTAALAADADWIDACLAVQAGSTDAGAVAARYVRRPGRSRSVLVELLRVDEVELATLAASGISERQAVKLALINRGRSALWCDAPADANRSRFRRAGTRYSEAAKMLAARGARRCIKCGQKIAQGDNCFVHSTQAAYGLRADQDAIRHLLQRAGDALGVE